MKLNILGVLLAAAQIFIAVWYFDRQDLNQVLVSVLLFLSGVITLFVNKPSKLKNLLQIVAGVIVAVIFIRLIFS